MYTWSLRDIHPKPQACYLQESSSESAESGNTSQAGFRALEVKSLGRHEGLKHLVSGLLLYEVAGRGGVNLKLSCGAPAFPLAGKAGFRSIVGFWDSKFKVLVCACFFVLCFRNHIRSSSVDIWGLSCARARDSMKSDLTGGKSRCVLRP